MDWVANAKPTLNWGVEEIHECVAPTRANPNCHTRLHLSMDWDNCYCAMGECDTVKELYEGMRTYREQTLQPYGETSLLALGEQYNNFVTTTGTPAPTSEPTDSPTSKPSTTPTKKPTAFLCQQISQCHPRATALKLLNQLIIQPVYQPTTPQALKC